MAYQKVGVFVWATLTGLCLEPWAGQGQAGCASPLAPGSERTRHHVPWWKQFSVWITYFHRTRVRSLGMLVSDSLTDWLTNWLLFSKLDWCDPGMWRWPLKLVEVVTVAHVDDEKRIDNSLVQTWKVKLGHNVKLLFRLIGHRQGFKVWLRFWSWSSGKILKPKFGHYIAADALLWLWSSILVEILKLDLFKILRFCRNADVWLRF